ncbi:MAG: amino acid adenylation domain-containing protein, partial [Syntrophothermus sp.]
IQTNTDLLVAAPRVFSVTGNEDSLNSLLNSAAGMLQVLERECPNIRCRFIDYDESFSASALTDEIKYGFKESYYYRAYRNAVRYIREIKNYDIAGKEDGKYSVSDGGVYLITGGTGGIGLELADMLCSQAKIKLVLLNRSEFPARTLWNSIIQEGKDLKLCRKIEKMIRLEEKAAVLEIHQCDVSSYSQLKTAVEDIRLRLGRICGVIHAAGTAGKGFIFGKTIEMFEDVIRPKIHGTVYLSELLKTDNPGFFIMTSALTAIIPTSGQSDYTAANAFQDAFSFELNKKGFRALSINLTSWKETGMAYEHGAVEDGIFRSISNIDGSAAVSKLLDCKTGSVILGIPDYEYLAGTENLPFYINMELKTGRTIKPAEKKDNTETGKTILLKGRDGASYSEYEIKVGSVWGKVLGYSEINIYDNYYDLGGDSIQAIKLVSMLEKKLNRQVTIGELFNHLTISDLAGYLESGNGEAGFSAKQEENIIPLLPSDQSAWYPVSSAQRRLFILDTLSKDKLSYHIPGIWNITGKLDADAIKKAFKKLIMRHEILRTSFAMADDVPVQIVHENIEMDIPVKEINESGARQYILEFIRPFDLSKAPLFRAEILKLDEENHLILFDAHHIITDGFSMEILKREVMTFYEGLEPEPLKIQYRDYAIWQNNYYLSAEAAEKKAYWAGCFDGEIPLINLPLDFPRTADSGSRAGTYTFNINKKLFQKIKKISSEEGVSPFMILLAAYNIVLHKYSGQDDIIVGVYTMGREKEELSKLIGMFINNLPVRTYPRGSATISGYLNEVKETAVKAFSNQDYPFDELVDILKIKRDLNRSPLFDVVFSYMNYEMSRLGTGDLQVGDYDADITISSEYDLMLYGLEAEDEIMITIKYKESLFKKQSMVRFAGHFTKVLDIMTGSRELMLKDIDMLLPEESAILNEYNRKSPEVTDKSDVIDLLKKAFAGRKEKTALIYNDRVLSYLALEEKTNRLAGYLRDVHSVRPEDRVAIMLERTDNMAVAMLAVIKSGAAYVGIDTAYPESRVEYLLNDCKAGILITEKSILENAKFKLPSGIAIVDIESPGISSFPAVEPVKVTYPDNLAYIIYTSGSTGNPKGVAITHKNLSVFLHWCFAEFGLSKYDMVYAVTSYCFDLSVFEIFFPLCAGKTIRILKSALEIPVYLPGDENVLINTVPSLMSAIHDELGSTAVSHIKAINLAGEQIPQPLIEKIDSGIIEVRNLYGPSEDTTYSTVYRFSSSDNKVLIGHPISNSRIYITDTYLKLVPPGHPGEICIAGDGLARGYLFRDDLTAEKFISNPFETGRLYRTGDLGRWTEDGEIEYLGRIDRQVKIRGYRIELGEIETNIRRHPSVAAAAVTA